MANEVTLTAGQAATFATRIYDHFQKGETTLLSPSYNPSSPVSGFAYQSNRYDAATNYYAEAYKNLSTGEVVVVSRGTVPDTRDVKANLSIASGGVPDSAIAALDFTRIVASSELNAGNTIISIGHSKGGFEAQYANLILTHLALPAGVAGRFLAVTVDAAAMGMEIVREAVAPVWEVSTARLQQDAGDPNAGQTEEVRVARRGLLAPVETSSNQRQPGEFRPIALDLDADGSITALSNADNDRAFNWDGSGFDACSTAAWKLAA